MSVITPINVADITQAVVEVLLADTRLHGVTVERSEALANSPDQCPRVGVYRIGVQYPQKVLAGVGGFRGQRVSLMLLVQHANGDSGTACENDLEALLVNVLSALMSNVTLNNIVQFLDEFEVSYTQYMRTTEGAYMQTATVQFVALTNTQITGG